MHNLAYLSSDCPLTWKGEKESMSLPVRATPERESATARQQRWYMSAGYFTNIDSRVVLDPNQADFIKGGKQWQ